MMAEPLHPMPGKSKLDFRRIIILALFVLSLSTQVVISWQSVSNDLLGYGVAASPVYWDNSLTITGTPESLRDSGIRRGDMLVAVNGRRMTGVAALYEPLAVATPGDGMTLTIASPGQAPRDIRIQLPAKVTEPRPIYIWAGILTLRVVMPLFTVLVGFGVVFLRPRDPMAWLFMILMVAFGMQSGQASTRLVWGWPAGIRELTLLHRTLSFQPWPMCMLLFGIYFPYRIGFDRRWPWLKWLLIIPLILTTARWKGSYRPWFPRAWIWPHGSPGGSNPSICF